MVLSMTKDDRRYVWDAIRVDDASALFHHLDSEEKIHSATTGLWNPNKREGIRDRPLVAVLSCNMKGVPSTGALRCLNTLLQHYGHLFSQDQCLGLARRARRKGRHAAAELLSTSVEVSSTTADKDGDGDLGTHGMEDTQEGGCSVPDGGRAAAAAAALACDRAVEELHWGEPCDTPARNGGGGGGMREKTFPASASASASGRAALPAEGGEGRGNGAKREGKEDEEGGDEEGDDDGEGYVPGAAFAVLHVSAGERGLTE